MSSKSDRLRVQSEAPWAIAQAAIAKSISQPRARGTREYLHLLAVLNRAAQHESGTARPGQGIDERRGVE